MDMVWRHLDVGIVPLLSILPLKNKDGTLFLHPVTDENVWRQFDSYARRVREFTHRCHDSQGAVEDIPDIHPSVYVLLARTKKYIFPNLRTLHAAANQSTTPLELILCITPSLRSFQLAPSDERYPLTDTTYTVGATLDMLATGNGGTPNVNIQYLDMRTVVPIRYLDKIVSLTNLRSLRVNGIIWEDDDVASDYILRLSMLPHLKDFLLSLQGNESFLPAPNGGFQSLKYLTIQSNVPSLENFFDTIPSNRLQYVTIMDNVEWNTRISGHTEMRSMLKGWCACFAALERQAKTLTTLRVTLWSTSADAADVAGCAKDLRMLTIIQPLLKLHALRTVELTGFIGMPYSDEDVLDIATAWPQIKYMFLPPPYGEVSQPSLTSLKFLSKFCPYLEVLSMGLDVSGRSSVEPHSEHSAHLETVPIVDSHPLTELDLCKSDLKVTDALRMAKSLRNLFPMLESVISTKNGEVAANITRLLRTTSHLHGHKGIP